MPFKNIKCLESISFSSKIGFFSPNLSFFHFFHAFGIQESDFKHSSFIAKQLQELGDFLCYFVTIQNLSKFSLYD